MNRLPFLAVTALALTLAASCPALSRPVIVEESARITNPDPAAYPDMGEVAIDGEFAIITAHRIIPADPGGDPNDFSRNIGVFLYKQAGGAWTLGPRLTEIHNSASNVFDYGIDFQDDVAALAVYPLTVFRRSGPDWQQQPVVPLISGPGRHVVIDNDRIFHGG